MTTSMLKVQQRTTWLLRIPNVLTETTAELGFTLLATARRIVEAEKYVEADAWQKLGSLFIIR